MKVHKKTENRRKDRVRSKLYGTADKPRLSVFRSNKNIYIQAINDKESKTLMSVSNLDKEIRKLKKTKTEIAIEVGKLFGKKLKSLKIEKAVFDRGSYKYHGRVKSLADGIRKEGVNF
jgi:large subunit ribosomal protein L18